jgi:electron transport complex protein RnfG
MKHFLPLLILVLIVIGCLLLVDKLTVERLRENRLQHLQTLLSAALDNSVQGPVDGDLITISEPQLTGANNLLYIYRQRSGGTITAIALYPVVARGYRRPIELAVGISADNRITGVRVIDQDETPGLGDRVDQSRSDWLQQFTGVALEAMQPGDWAVSHDQGKFDALSGATITSRGVINAVHKTAEIHAIRKETFYSYNVSP